MCFIKDLERATKNNLQEVVKIEFDLLEHQFLTDILFCINNKIVEDDIKVTDEFYHNICSLYEKLNDAEIQMLDDDFKKGLGISQQVKIVS